MATSTGCMLGWYDANGYTSTNGLEDMEAILDTHFAVVRIYHAPGDWGTLKSLVGTVLDDGRLPMVSHKPPKVANSWVAMARGDYDAQIDAIVAAYKALDDQEIIVIFHHEPHDQASDLKNGNHGTAADFVKAYRRFAKAFRDAGADNIKLGYCAVADTWATKGTPNGSADKCYPGSDYVDVLCHDEYNTWGDDGENTNNPDPAFDPDPADWDSMEEVMYRSVATAKAQNKPLIFGEIGSQHGVGAKDRDEWFRTGAAWLKTGDAKNYVLGFCYYHVDNHDQSGHWWRFAQGRFTDGKTGYKDGFSHDPYFLTVPIPVALRGAVPPGSDYGENSPSGGTPGYIQPTKWAARVEASGLSSIDETSGLASSPLGGAWAIRDSGKPNDLYWITQASRAQLNSRAITVTGSTNADWEDVIRVVEGGVAYLYIHDNRDGNSAGANPKRLYKVAEPADPATATSVSLISTRYWKFPDSASSSTCGSKQNCEAIFYFKGHLYAVQKTDATEAEVYDLGDPNALSTTNTMPGATEGVKNGTIAIHCPSCFSIHADGRTVLVCQHGQIKVFRGSGTTVQSLLTGKNTKVFEDSPTGSYEGGDWYPFGSNDFLLVSEGHDVADYDATEGFATGGGIGSTSAFGTPIVALASGALTITSVGAILSPADYDPNEEEAGLDFGLLSAEETGYIAPTGIDSTAAVGTPTVTRDEGTGYLFSPPIRYYQSYAPAARGLARRLFRYYDGIPTAANVYVLIDGTVTETQPWDQGLITKIYFGGHVTEVDDTEAEILTDAGYGPYLLPKTPPVGRTWGAWAGLRWGELHGETWGGLPSSGDPTERLGHYGGYSEDY